MAVFIVPTLGVGWQSFTNGGLVNASGTIDTFQAGTSTVTSVYTTSAGNVAHANPIVLDSTGRLPAGGEMWSLANVAMKFVIKDSTSSAIQTIDNIYGIGDLTAINSLGPAGATVSAAINMNAAAVNEAQGANIPIAAVVNLTTATGNYLAFTGAGTVTSITLSPAGVYREAVVTNTCAFTNNANILLLGNTSITANPGDIIGFRGEASGVVRNTLYQRVTGVSLATGTPQAANTVLAGPTSGSVAVPTFRGLVPADLGLTFTSSTLGANVVMTSSLVTYDGPSVSTGAVGTWFVAGSVAVNSTIQFDNIVARLWDGTTTIVSAKTQIADAGAVNIVSLSGFITSPAGNLKISCKDGSSNNGAMLFNTTGFSTDCTIAAMRIA